MYQYSLKLLKADHAVLWALMGSDQEIYVWRAWRLSRHLLVLDTHLREMVSQFQKKSQKHLDEKWRRSISAVQYITQSYEGFSRWARYVGIIFPENISEILNIFFGFLISKELNLNINVTFQMDRTTIVNRFKIFKIHVIIYLNDFRPWIQNQKIHLKSFIVARQWGRHSVVDSLLSLCQLQDLWCVMYKAWTARGTYTSKIDELILVNEWHW